MCGPVPGRHAQAMDAVVERTDLVGSETGTVRVRPERGRDDRNGRPDSAGGRGVGRRDGVGVLRARAAVCAAVALGLMTLAVVLIGWLHVATPMDPVRMEISDYIFTGDGAVLLPGALLAMAGAVGLLAYGLRAVGPPAGRRGLWLLGVAGAALVGLALFPADRVDTDPSPAGLAHKASGVVLFLALPLFGLLMARRPGAGRARRPLVALVAMAAATLLAFLLCYLGVLGWLPGGANALGAARGLSERLMLLPEIGLLVVLALRCAAARRISALPARPAGQAVGAGSGRRK